MIICDVCGSERAAHGFAFSLIPPGEYPTWRVELDLCSKCWANAAEVEFKEKMSNVIKVLIEARRREIGGAA